LRPDWPRQRRAGGQSGSGVPTVRGFCGRTRSASRGATPRRFDSKSAVGAQIIRLGATLLSAGSSRLERLRGSGAGLGRALTCACSRVVNADGTAFADNGEAVLRVRDTSAGMNEKHIGATLEPFREVATSGSWGSGGTGLGLPSTKALAEANRAHFSIKSAANAGTLIEVAFPPGRDDIH
jgi:hypothetical protein